MLFLVPNEFRPVIELYELLTLNCFLLLLPLGVTF